MRRKRHPSTRRQRATASTTAAARIRKVAGTPTASDAKLASSDGFAAAVAADESPTPDIIVRVCERE
jgi:hypothetical protein